mmetsp:Transcript_33890/g.59070  ORF Transcript_33890/g.59070 Transcript_33890/m.59070 type:complete len:439 (-) Transcript_33890:3042-4358(-)|eukprot:CAMPEP_0204898580 /NCGR_PEP_ID=MMETSP1397-20131031/1374_1 /ASSEMBLY_ACC=CAM_ASM_000891 /TAXON_ID=49980 /ORGANISM="Climacostomum Climacostomum virens, Strain Stock W-24" /LENGTH=438 /DNA_ID=CAMNT_0052066455 /DNA_START=504 /DNA_END=1820 /DNA_ORIENTATION=+
MECDTCDKPAELICPCRNSALCTNCLLTHMRNDLSVHHRPTPISLSMQTSYKDNKFSPTKQKLGYCLEELNRYRLEATRRLRSFTESLLREVVRVAEMQQRNFEFDCTAFENELRMAFNTPDHQVHTEPLGNLLNLGFKLSAIDASGLYAQSVQYSLEMFKQISRLKHTDVEPDPRDDYGEVSLGLHKLVPGTSIIEVIDLESETKKRVQLQSPERFSRGSFVCNLSDNCLFITGGESQGSKISLPSAMLLDTLDFQLEVVAPMKSPRSYHCSVKLDNYVYAIGGLDVNGQKMTACEVYDKRSDRWTEISSLCVSRSYHSACGYLGKVFVVGGWDTRAIEVYNPIEDSFNLLTTKLSTPGPCTLAQYTSSCILFAGSDVERLYLNSMTVSPISQLDRDQWWSQYQPIIADRFVFILRHHDDKVYKYDTEARQMLRLSI